MKINTHSAYVHALFTRHYTRNHTDIGKSHGKGENRASKRRYILEYSRQIHNFWFSTFESFVFRFGCCNEKFLHKANLVRSFQQHLDISCWPWTWKGAAPNGSASSITKLSRLFTFFVPVMYGLYVQYSSTWNKWFRHLLLRTAGRVSSG